MLVLPGNIITQIFNDRGIKYALQFSVHERRYYFVTLPEKKFAGPDGFVIVGPTFITSRKYI